MVAFPKHSYHMHTHVRLHMHKYKHMHTRTHAHIHTYWVCIRKHMHIKMHARTLTHQCTHTNTHTSGSNYERREVLLLIPTSDSLHSCWQNYKLSEDGSERNSPSPSQYCNSQDSTLHKSAQLHISTSVWMSLFFYVHSMRNVGGLTVLFNDCML